MGCKESCRRSTLEKHLKEECYVAQQMKAMDTANLIGGGGGELTQPSDHTTIGGNKGIGGDETTSLPAIVATGSTSSTDREYSHSYSDYEIVCPYAFMGCTFTCRRTVLHR